MVDLPAGPDVPVMYRAIGVEDEAEGTKVVWLGGRVRFDPGRFFMVWLPGVDEKPYAISHTEPDRFAITVEVRGRFSRALTQVRRGELVGLRGPYGRGFKLSGRACLVAGGMGIAGVALLHERHPESPLLYGARTAAEGVFLRRFPAMRLFTDDGSAGEKGLPTDALPGVIERNRIEMVCACGPEPMLKRVFDICEEHGIECQASLERYMKCGIGVCGHCACGEMLVCRDGPVFGSEELRRMRDFGRYALLKNGRRVPISEYLRKP
jgi:dihydroorotate dehydrogenase electron transfer subunit